MNNLKKIIGIFSIFSFIGLNISFATTGIVNTPAARVREKASTDSKVITKAYEDEEVEILEEAGDWYKVKVNGKTGFVSKSLIKVSGSTNSNTTSKSSTNTSANNENNTNTSTNNTNTVNATTNTSENNVSTYTTKEPKDNEYKNVINQDTSLRLLPNFASNELKFLSKDTEVKIEKELNYWVKISLADNSNGWVLKNNVTYGNIDTSETKPNEETNTNTVENNTNTQATNTTANNTEANTIANSTEESNSSDKNTNTTAESNSSDKKNNTVTESNSEVKNIKGKVKVETANVREKPNKSSSIIERLDEDDIVTIVEETGDWYKITSSKVSSGYVAKSLIKVISSDVSSRSLSETREETNYESVNSSTSGEDNVKESENILENGEEKNNQSNNFTKSGEAVVEYAKQFLGVKYVLGGKTPESGFDCSGFTRYIFKNFGYSLGSVAAEQDSVGAEVKREDIKPGDLILFQNEGKTKIGHTGIYIGNNEFIHAANPQRGVVIDNLETNSYYSERFVTARRIGE